MSLLVPFLIGGAMLIQTLNAHVIVNALPTMAVELDSDPAQLNVLITAYLLAMAAFLPLSGWCADRFGSRTVFRNAILLYIVSSLLCGLAQNSEQLLAARILSGFAAAMMTPVGRVVLLRNVPRAHFVQAISIVTVPSMLGPVIGPPLGGLIVTFWSWHWIFFINIPIGLIAAVLITIYIPHDEPLNKLRLDVKGAMLSGGGLSVLLFGLQNLVQDLISTEQAVVWTLLGMAMVTLYWLHARRLADPVLDFSLFKYISFRAGVIGGQFARILIGAMPFLLALLFQIGFGMNALASGLLTLTSAVAAILMKVTATRLIHKFGYRRILLVNSVLVAISFGALAFVTEITPIPVLIAILFTGGFFRSLQFTALNSVTFNDLEPKMLSGGSTLLSMSQPMAQSLGISIAASLVQLFSWSGEGAISTATIAPVFLIIGVFSLAASGFFLKLPRDAGMAISERNQG